jgi:uncharacterized protein YbjT (DUF2867 family)
VILVTTAGKVGAETVRLLRDRDVPVRVLVRDQVTNKAGADSPIARRRWQAEIEAGLAASGIPHTLLRANAFMQNVLAAARVFA